VRCSSLDSLFSCPASILASGPALIRIAAENEAASLGKAVHECCATLIPKGAYDLTAAAERHGISEEAKSEAVHLLFYAAKAWTVLAKYFNPDPDQRITEAGISGPVLDAAGEQYQIAGNIDLCSPVDQDKAIFLDWKSGYIDDGFYQQMSGYAYLLWCHMGRPARVSITGVVVFLRHQYWRVLRYNAETLSQWEHDLVHNLLSRPDSFRPGRACPHCELFATCPARQAVSIQTIRDILGGDTEHPDRPGWWDRAKSVMSQLTVDNKAEKVVGETVSDVVFRIRMLSSLIDAARDVLRDSIKRVGPIPLGDGVQLALRPVFIEKIKSEVAIPLLRNYLSDGQLADCMTLSLPKILTAYANSKPGESGWKKSGARKMLHGQLLDAGAVIVTRQERMEEVHSDPQETEDGNNSGEPTGPSEQAG
jgi:hypothetical protein